MAENKDKDLSLVGKNKKLMNNIQSSMDRLYKNTHFTNPNNYNDLDDIKNNINKSIDNMIGGNVEQRGIPNISRLYARLNNEKESDKDLIDLNEELNQSAFGMNLLETISGNKAIKDYDEEIDQVCKYMPSLEDALDAKKDNVLSADHFNKDFINCIPKSNQDKDVFSNDIQSLKKKYNLIEKFEDIYDHTARYGETFIYCVPYKKALDQLLKARRGTIVSESIQFGMDEDCETITLNENEVNGLFENGVLEGNQKSSVINSLQNYSVDVKIDSSMVYTEAVIDQYNIEKFKKKIDSFNKKANVFKGTSTTDGLINSDMKKQQEKNKIDVPGCIIKELPRANVIPLYIENSCLAYYYIECDTEEIFDDQGLMTSKGTFSRAMSMDTVRAANKVTIEDQLIKNISNKIGDKLDEKFINANPDLADEIYKILKNNINETNRVKNVKVSVLSPNDIIHSYFKLDPKTHRGISDLDRALIPAKIFSSLYLTSSLGILTKGQDKRIYYVKNAVDSNISGTLLNVINQLRRSNMGAREFSNFKNLLKITGRFNEMVIPTGASGDPPIQFEVMQGQDINTQEDFMNRLEQMAINSTDVPYEYIQSRTTVDYAVRLTMSSGKFLRKVFKRQSRTQIIFSRIMNIIYKSEYEDKSSAGDEDSLEVTLPPPALLNILNSNQMFESLEQYSQSLSNMFYSDTDDPDQTKRQIFIKNVKKHYTGTLIDGSALLRIKEQSEMELNKLQTGAEQQ